MKQSFITFLLSVLMSMTGAKAFAHDIAVANDDDVTIYYQWTNNNTELAVSDRGSLSESFSNEYSGNVVIPKSVEFNGNTYPVTSIGDWAFFGCSDLTSVTIPNSVTSIGIGAFQGCSDLTSVTIPNSVTSIGSCVFFDCSGLTSVAIPNSVTYIGGRAFWRCSGLTSVAISNSVTYIGDQAFWGCSGLTSVAIPNSVTYIGDNAFCDCNGLTSVIVNCSPTYIYFGSSAFLGCTKIEDVTFDCEIVLPLFSDNSSLKKVKLSENVKTIGDYAFKNCNGLTSVIVNCNPTYIGSSPFLGCTKIEEISFDCETVTSLFRDLTDIKKVTLSKNVKTICSYAFQGYSSLTSVTIPNSVTSIGSNAFQGCSGLTSVTIPNSVTTIGSYAFQGCSGLTSVTIPNKVRYIGCGAFNGCSSMASLTIGTNVEYIGSVAFGNCSQLTDVYCLADRVPYYCEDIFDEYFIINKTLHVPSWLLSSYNETEPWRIFSIKVPLDDDEIPETPKCATPEISFENGRVKFNCATEGVEYISDIIMADEHNHYDTEILLSQKYKITVYATKVGYENSDIATREIVIENGQTTLFGDLNKDGEVNVADHVELTKIIMNQE